MCADADTIAEAYFTAVDATETAHLLQTKNIDKAVICSATCRSRRPSSLNKRWIRTEPFGNPVKSEHVGERRNLRQSSPLNQL